MSIIEKLPAVKGLYRENADLSKLCWFNTGGKASVLYKPANIEDLAFFLANKPKDIKYFVLGIGSNILIRDKGFEGVVIRLGREFNYVKCEDNYVRVGAATLDLNVALACVENDIAGLEFLSGIPGTIGGALAMNAGAYGKEIKDIFVSASAIDEFGNIIELSQGDIKFCYRGNNLSKNLIFVEAVLKGEAGDKHEIARRISSIQQRRADTQPIKTKTGGSTFKNPPDHKAWQLIDQAGCRGLKIGGAQVSPMHCNFFINTGNATAQDLEDLINEVKARVLEKTGIALETEIKIV